MSEDRSNAVTAPRDPGVRWNVLLAIYVVVFTVAWVLVPLAMNREPPGDNLEQLDWAQHLAWGYDKHPPLPTLILWLFEKVFPIGVPLTCALGGMQVASMLFLAWAIVRTTLDSHRAAIAVLLISCVTFYTNRLHFYNHNTGLLVAYAMSVYCVFRAAQSGRFVWYALLGVTWGLGLLSKYQMVIAMACNGVFLLWIVRFQIRKLIVPMLVAIGTCGIIVAPHVVWLFEHHFPSFDYAAKFVAADLPWWQRPSDIGGFIANQIARIAPLAALLAILRNLPRIRRLGKNEHLCMADASPLAQPLLVIHAWGPLLLMSSLSLFFGIDLQMHWGTAFLWMLPIWFLRTQHGRAIANLPLTTILAAVASLQVVMLLAYR